MAGSNIKTIRKLQMAINMTGHYKILYHTSQFYSVEQQRPVQKYHIKQAKLNEETGRSESEEIFSTYSQMQIILYLRDYWYILNGLQVPHDNEQWDAIKEEHNIEYKDVR